MVIVSIFSVLVLVAHQCNCMLLFISFLSLLNWKIHETFVELVSFMSEKWNNFSLVAMEKIPPWEPQMHSYPLYWLRSTRLQYLHC